MNQKLLLASVVAALTLTACSKPADESSQANTSAEQVASPASDDAAEHATIQEEHDHAHEHHDDHAGHMHVHADGDAYQCGDQTVHIVVHNHEGEIEAHLNHDGIEYDFNQDPSNKNQYTSNHGFADNQKTILTIDGNKAVVTGDTNQVLLDCIKVS
ncbi:hypothetical protein AO373_1188 [Moraxella catarrhalis]|uniref:hypothetical protein n=1 Tax=Moraxella catarrhalis TaxID=480 RepID=UPI0007E405B5|nr:hypothetical protein [Moraxella catarrhalis]OAV07491.1 hypothetical protein AO379_0024 [Moraxella catarrhalis]OAV18604.1 hypothetical protein AO373_1188 [Moraxella catarrhalis]